MNTDLHRYNTFARLCRLCLLSTFVGVILCTYSACSSKPTDIRSVIPADSLAYLEANDLGKALRAVTNNDAFRKTAAKQPDFSALDGIKLGVAVTGFETREQKVTDENSVLNFQPHFVAVAETNLWNFQANAFAENKLGEFINDIYGGEVKLETFPKYDGQYFVWTAQDGRKAYALVIDRLIFFGNDDTAIEKCVAVRKGEAESISKNSKLPTGEFLSSGYVSTEGVAQLANIVGIHMALGAGDENDVRGFVAKVLPEILRNSLKDVSWTASAQTDNRIEDAYKISLGPEMSDVLSETLIPGSDPDPDLCRFTPSEFVSTTQYNFKDPQIAWRSFLITARSRTDNLTGKIIEAFSSSLFEPFGIHDQEMFLNSIEGAVQTVRFDTEGDEVAAISRMRDVEKMKRSLSKDINFSRPAEKFENADVWRSGDGELAVGIIQSMVVLGDAKAVEKCLRAQNTQQNFGALPESHRFLGSKAPMITVGSERETPSRLAAVLSESKDDKGAPPQLYSIETSFSKNGIVRHTVSDFGLIGSIIEQFDKE